MVRTSFERLQNILAHAGVASRRASAALIESGVVTVDGLVVREPGARFAGTEQIMVNGKPLAAMEKKRTIVLYKPVGVLSTMADPFGGKTVAELVTTPERLVPVGRLDKDSEGLLLMSNDGDLINHLTHPRFEHRKYYHVQVAGRWTAEKLATLRSAITLDDGYTIRPCIVNELNTHHSKTDHQCPPPPLHSTSISHHCPPPPLLSTSISHDPNVRWLEFILTEGRKRQIRKMCSAAHLVVLALKRVAVGNFKLPRELAPGEWRDLTAEEISSLMR